MEDTPKNKAENLEESVTTREAAESDKEFARTTHHAAYHDVVVKQFGSWDEKAQDGYFEESWHPESTVVILDSGIPCGYCLVQHLPRMIFVHELVIAPEHQKKGVGSKILSAIMKEADEKFMTVELQVLKQNSAQHFYRKLGFEEIGLSDEHIMMEYHGPIYDKKLVEDLASRSKPKKALSEKDDFRKMKHEGWNTPQNVIADAVTRAVGAGIKEQTRIVNGETNEVYSVMTDSGQELIVRLAHSEKNRFPKEKWAFDQSAQAGAPVPEMLLVDSVELEGQPLQICVESKLEGHGLGRMPGADDVENHPELKEVLRQFGEALGKVHSVKTDGFGVLDKNGKGPFASVPELISADEHRGRNKILPFFENQPAEHQVLLRAYEILEQNAGNYSQIQPVLLHNDLAPDHVLVEGDKLTGLIDFESAVGGDPMMEFALWDFKFGEKYPLRYILDGYQNDELFAADYEHRLNFWKIHRALGSLRYCIEQKKEAGIDRAIKVISKSNEFFK